VSLPLKSKLYDLLGRDHMASDCFIQSLTHRSAHHMHNERMEFLGDSVLGLVVTKTLYHHMPKATEGLPTEESLKDPKSRLQELLQSRKLEIPRYELVDTSGDDHRQIFTAECEIPSLSIKTKGVSSSRRKAEQQAALNAYESVIECFKKK